MAGHKKWGEIKHKSGVNRDMVYAETVTGENMTEPVFNLADIPDLSGIEEDRSEPWADGWYAGTILARREFTDSNGNDRVFESGDVPAQSSASRNVRLQVVITRHSDGRTLNTNASVNYRPEDITVDTIRAIAAHREQSKVNGGTTEWGSLFRPFMTLTRLGKLQKIAGVRQFQRNGDGGLDLTPLFGKTAYFKLQDDRRNPKYKEVADFRETRPVKVPVL